MEAEREEHKCFMEATRHMRAPQPIEYPIDWKPVKMYLKHKLAIGTIFSLPKSFFHQVTEGHEYCNQPYVRDATQEALQSASVAPTMFEFIGDISECQVFCCVTNNFPEKRHLVPVHHLDKTSDELHVAKLNILEIDGERIRLTAEGATKNSTQTDDIQDCRDIADSKRLEGSGKTWRENFEKNIL